MSSAATPPPSNHQPCAFTIHDVDAAGEGNETTGLIERLAQTSLLHALTPGAGLDLAMLVALETQRGCGVRLLTVERAGDPVAAALMTVSRARTPWPVVTLAGAGVVDRLAFAVDGPDDVRQTAGVLADAVLSLTHRHRGARLVLPQLPENDPVLTELARRAPVSETREDDVVPLLEWHADSAWANKKTRNKYRAGLRRLDASGSSWRLERLSDPHAILGALPDTLALRSERELALGRADSFAEAAVRDLHLARVAALAANRDAQLWHLTIDEELVAYAVLGREDERVEFLDSRIRPGYEALGPGMVLFGAMTYTWFHHGFHGPDGDVRAISTPAGAARRGAGVIGKDTPLTQVRAVDFGRGTNDFKRQFHTRDERRVVFTAWPNTTAQNVWHLAAATSEAARKPLRLARDRSRAVAGIARRVRTAQMSRKASRGARRG